MDSTSIANSLSDHQYIQHFRLDDVMQHLTYALLKHRPVDHALFTKRWLQHLKIKMDENGTPNSAVGLNLLDLDGTVAPKVLLSSVKSSVTDSSLRSGKQLRSLQHKAKVAQDPSASYTSSRIERDSRRGTKKKPVDSMSERPRSQAAKALVDLIDKMDQDDIPSAYKQLETILKNREQANKKKQNENISAHHHARDHGSPAPQGARVTVSAPMNQSGVDDHPDQPNQENVKRRIGISATPMMKQDLDYKPPVFEKSKEELQALLDSLSKSTLFANMMDEQRLDIALAMQSRDIGAGEPILRQGHPSNDLLYYTMSGQVDIIKDGKVVAEVGSGHYFGEMELMTNGALCAATVQTATEVHAYVLEKETYQNLVLNFTLANRKKFEKLVDKVDFFQALPDYEKLTLAEALNTARYEDGDHIIRCGEQSPWMYIIMIGAVTVVGRKDGAKVKIIDLGPGDVVGELEFLFHHDAVADVVASGSCTVAKMSRQHFEMCCGSVDDNLKQFVVKGKYEHYMKHASENVHTEIKAAERRQAKRVGEVGEGGQANYPEFLPEGEICFGSGEQNQQVFRFPLLPTQHDKLCLVGVQEDGTILFWNTVMAQLTRFPETEAVGSSVFSFAASPHDQKILHELVSVARKWTGNCEGFFAAGEYTRRTIAFANANGISKSLLNMSVIPPTVAQPKTKAEILLLVAHEGKRKAPPPAFDVGEWLMNGLRPKIEGLTRDVSTAFQEMEGAVSRAAQSTSVLEKTASHGEDGPPAMEKTGGAQGSPLLDEGGMHLNSSNSTVLSQAEVKTISKKIQAQMLGLERHIQKFESVVNVDLGALSADWQAISVRLMAGRVQTEISADVRNRGNKFNLVVQDDVPMQNIYMDVTTLSEALLYVLKKTNATLKDREITLTIQTEVVEEAAKAPTKSITKAGGRTRGQSMRKRLEDTMSGATSPSKETFASQFSQSYMKATASPKASVGTDSAAGSPFDTLGGTLGNTTILSASGNTGKEGTPEGKESDLEGSIVGANTSTGLTPNSNASLQNHRRLIKYVITDDGPGLPKDVIATILDRDGGTKANAELLKKLDQPLDESQSFNRGGKVQGLGLRKCAGNINRSGGTFEIKSTNVAEVAIARAGGDSSKQTSTCFVMGFPLLVDHSEDGDAAESGSPMTKGNGKPCTTVLVESNQVHRSAFCSFLWGRRHAVLPADNWAQVLQLIKDGTCDILILDPEALLEEFVDEEGLPTDPMLVLRQHTKKMAVIVTSESFDPELCTSNSTGVLALPKPCPVATLHVVVQQAEVNVATIREEAERVAGLRDTFNKIKRSDVQIGKMLGKGSFGGVYEALDVLTGGKMAMKQLKVTDGNRAAMEELANEIETMTTLQHENIVHYFYCTFESVGKDGQPIQKEESQQMTKQMSSVGTEASSAHEHSGGGIDTEVSQAIEEAEANIKAEEKMNVFMELADGGTVADRIKNHQDGMPLEELVPLLRGTLDGLAFVHGVNMVHCDMKPANIFLDRSGKPKIGDFGTAKVLAPGEKVYVMKGTPLYMSPECMNADIDDGIGFDISADIWSLGCIVLEMATGFAPFSRVPTVGGPMGIFSYVGNLKDPPDLSPLFKKPPAIFEFVKACLDPDPAKRATAKQLQNFSLITDGDGEGDGRDGGPALGAQKMLARARLLHVLNKFVAFQEDSDADYTDDDSNGPMARTSKAIKDADADDFFADSDEEEEEDEGGSPTSPSKERKIVVPKRRDADDFFADSEDEEEEQEESGSECPSPSDNSRNTSSSRLLKRTVSKSKMDTNNDVDDYRPVLFGGGGTRRGWAAGGVAPMSVDLGGGTDDEENN